MVENIHLFFIFERQNIEERCIDSTTTPVNFLGSCGSIIFWMNVLTQRKYFISILDLFSHIFYAVLDLYMFSYAFRAPFQYETKDHP